MRLPPPSSRAVSPLLALALVLGGGGCASDGAAKSEPLDADFDGFVAADDCDDSDPYVHPGAPEQAGDGVDADCDGDDGAYAYVGTYALTYLYAGFSGFPILTEDTESGTLTVDPSLAAVLSIGTQIDEDVVGFDLPVDLELDGTTVPMPVPGEFTLQATGEWNDEEVYVNWTCETASGELACLGELKLLGYGFENEAVFDVE